MTRKDYVALAAALRSTSPTYSVEGTGTKAQWRDDVQAITDVLAKDNPRFDHARFYAACGMERAS